MGDAWRRRWDSLRLFTSAAYSGLPGMPFPAPPAHFPDKDEVADYLSTPASTERAPCAARCCAEQVAGRVEPAENAVSI